jgi:hypothetical protein
VISMEICRPAMGALVIWRSLWDQWRRGLKFSGPLAGLLSLDGRYRLPGP